MLGALDDKIELNRRMNATLEAMARALFQSWFVDFDPVRAKLDGRQPTGLDPATAALFPNEFEDSELARSRKAGYKGEGLRNNCPGLPMHNLNSVYEGGGYEREGLKYYAGEYRKEHRIEPGNMIITTPSKASPHLLIGHAAIVPMLRPGRTLQSPHLSRSAQANVTV